jgi:hypothetical protein
MQTQHALNLPASIIWHLIQTMKDKARSVMPCLLVAVVIRANFFLFFYLGNARMINHTALNNSNFQLQFYMLIFLREYKQKKTSTLEVELGVISSCCSWSCKYYSTHPGTCCCHPWSRRGWNRAHVGLLSSCWPYYRHASAPASGR